MLGLTFLTNKIFCTQKLQTIILFREKGICVI